jgi:DNA polymerase-4
MILHIDMDAFYAAVEQRDNPELAGRCVIVGGQSPRGVVSAANYAARKFGVHSAMPMFQARRKCPQAIILPPRMQRYQEASERVMIVLREISPLVEQISIDEAYVDVSGCERISGDPVTIGRIIKKRIRVEVGLTCSVGIAPVKFLAKVASDLEKPDGLTTIAPEDVPAFVDRLAIKKVPGVGPKAEEILKRLGIAYLGDVRRFSEDTLVRRLGRFGQRLARLAMGQDDSPVNPDVAHKSVSREQTLDHDTADRQEIKKYLLRHAEKVSRDLRRMGVTARTVTLKMKHADFKLVTRRVTLDTATDTSKTLYTEAVKLLEEYRPTDKVRLIGLGASGLVSGAKAIQMGLFDTPAPKKDTWSKIDRTVDSLSQKYGRDVVTRASLTPIARPSND